MKIDLNDLTIKKTHTHLLNGDFSVLELTESYLKNIEEKNPEINAFLEVFDDCKKQAEESQKLFSEKKAGLLTGIPFSIKDNILIKGRIASASSRMLENYRATYDATVISKLKKEKSVFLGRVNMDEFAMGSSTENSAFGTTRNPIDTTRVPGGSSGGSAASVAANFSLVSLGSDTNGSVRAPASFCGLVGLKPTYGRVSRNGLMAMASSLDQIGPLAKTVEDTKIIFDHIKGKDLLDSTTIEAPDNFSDDGKIKIGVPKNLLELEGMDPEVKENFDLSVKKLEDKGFEIVEISLPNAHYALPAYYIIMPAEVSSNLARYDGVKYGFLKEGNDLLSDYLNTRTEGFGKETRRRILLGTYVLSSGYYDAFYSKANIIRKLVIKDFEKVWKDHGVSAVITPTTPTTAFKIGERVSDPLSMYMSDILTSPSSIAGLPSISLPSGFDSNKLPIGLQVVAPYFREDILFDLGKKFLGEE